MSNSSNPSGRPAATIPASSANPATDKPDKPDSTQTAPRWLGKRVGRFRLQAIIGQGAMGRVFRADDKTLQRRVALKIIPLHDRSGQINPNAQRFITEARAAAALEHPHVVQIFEAGEFGRVCYIAMELLEGGSLAEVVDSSGPLDVQRACQLIAEAAEALAAAHALGIIHRDVKPANLMLSRGGRCKVTDFGLAMIDEDISDDALTDRHRRVGTALFVAPEVIRGICADASSDLYSLGGTLFYLLTGRPPFVAKGRAETMRAHLEQNVPDIRSFRPDVPDALAQAISRSLDKDPGRRFASMQQFSRILRVFTIPVAAAPSPPPRPAQPPPPAPVEPTMSASTVDSLTGSFSSSSALSGSIGPVQSINSPESTNSTDHFSTPVVRHSRIAAADDLGALAQAVAATADRADASFLNSQSTVGFPQSIHRSMQIPIATIAPRSRKTSMVLIAGLAAGAAIVVVAFILWRNSSAITTAVASAITPSAAPAPEPSPAPEAVPAAYHQDPAPPIAAVAPVQPIPQPRSSPAPATRPAAVQSAPLAVPTGVLHPWDIDQLRLIADGKDPVRPDSHGIIQGLVASAAPSSTGKVFHIRFVGVDPDAFEVVFFQSNDMIDKMNAAFGGSAENAFRGKTLRVSGKLRVYHDTLVQLVPDSPDRFTIVSNP